MNEREEYGIEDNNKNKYNHSSSCSSHKSQKNNEIIHNYSYEDLMEGDEIKADTDESQHQGMLLQSEINQVKVSPFPGSQVDKEDQEQLEQQAQEQIIDIQHQEEDKPQNQEQHQDQDHNTIPEELPSVPVNKTIFSKLSEDMYNSIVKQWEKQIHFTYDEFINENFLEKYSNKINGDNALIIKDFLERNEKYLSEKSYNVKTINCRVEQIENIHETKKTDMNQTMTEAFYIKQKNYMEMKNNSLQALRDEITKEKEKEMKPVPTINKKSKLYPYQPHPKKPSIIPEENSKVNKKLKTMVIEKKKKKKTKTDTIEQKRQIKLTQKEIMELVEKLYIRHKGNEHKPTLRKCKSCSIFNESKLYRSPSNLSKASSTILIQVLMRAIDKEINSLKNESMMVNPILTFKEYNDILSHMGYIPTENNNNMSKSHELALDIWKTYLLKPNDIHIQSHSFIVFFLCLEGLDKQKDIITKICPWLILTSEHNNLIISKTKDIVTKYKLLSANKSKFTNNNKRQRHLLKNSHSTSSIYALDNFKPRTDPEKSLNFFYKTLQSDTDYHPIHRLKISQSYNIIRRRHLDKMNKIKEEMNKRELSECTFFPNKSQFIKRSISSQASSRLYASVSKKNIKKKILSINENKQDNPLNKTTGSNKIVNNFKPIQCNQDMFYYNPIAEDNIVQENIERYEKARIEKKLKEYMLTKGVYSIEQLRILAEKDLIEEEKDERKLFRFDNEIKNNKETFGKFDTTKGKNNKKRNLQNNNLKEKSDIMSSCRSKTKRELLLSFEIKIKDKRTVLNYYQNDDVEKLVSDFVKKNNLSKESKKQIIQVLYSRLNNNTNTIE